MNTQAPYVQQTAEAIRAHEDELIERVEAKRDKTLDLDNLEPILKRTGLTLDEFAEAYEIAHRRKNGGNGHDRGAGAELVRLSTIEAQPLRWLWPGKIPTGKLTLLVGDPGLGKSVITLDLAARVTIGSPWPDGGVSEGPGDVIILSAEDDPADTIRPRLEVVGADLDRTFILRCIRKEDGKERTFSLTADLGKLKEQLEHLGDTVKLLIIDPVSAYLGDTDSHVDASVRSVLAPLAELAAQYGVAVLGVSHLNKGQGAAIYRVQGSIAFTAAARAVWAVGKDPEDDTGRRRLLLPVKCNLAPDIGGIAYGLEDANGIATVHWGDPVTADVHEVMGPIDELGAKDEAVRFLEDILSDGPMLAVEVYKEARKNGIKDRTLRRAKKELGAVAQKRIGQRGSWEWLLQEEDY